MHLPCTTVAGRHAAQRERENAARLLEFTQDDARRKVDQTIRAHGLTTFPHFDRDFEAERSLWVNCRLDTARQDHAVVYAILDLLGWQPDVTRLSRFQQSHDVLRLTHQATAATLVLIIKLPFAELPQLEAA